jgi:GSH-dependent disulfide-bond oxidoreductase
LLIGVAGSKLFQWRRHDREDFVIELYTWSTPNGRKISIALEEFGLPYRVHPVDIGRGEQHQPEFLRINPNGKIPAIVDLDNGRSLMESGAILLYLAERQDRFWGDDRWQTVEWLMLQMGGVGPMLGQAHHFLHFNPGKAPYAEERYRAEARRLYGVLDRRLVEHAYLSGSYSIADMATWPWISRYQWQGIDWSDYPNLRRWYLAIADRPAVRRGYDVPRHGEAIPLP